ncbi:hypothetical protein Tco_0496546 [Tanacetum coccineum]
MATLNEPTPQGEVNTVGSGEDSMEQDYELTINMPPTPHDSPLSGGNTPGSNEGRMELIQELMETCTLLTKRVLALEEAKTTQDKVITILKLRARRLEKKRKARTPQPMKRRLFNGRVKTSTDISLEDKGSGEKGGSTADQVNTTRPEVIKKRKYFRDVEETPRLIRSTTTLQPLPTIDPKDKGKGVLVEKEKLEKVKRKDHGLAQIESDVELAQRIHEEELVELDRAQKERQKEEEATNAALAEEIDEIQARMDVIHELAVRLALEEQEQYTFKERARLLAEYFERRKKQLVTERAEAIRNKSPA